jgi:hypothetical protein
VSWAAILCMCIRSHRVTTLANQLLSSRNLDFRLHYCKLYPILQLT